MNLEETYKQAMFFENDKQYTEAVKLYNILIANKEDARYYIAFGVCLQKLKHWKQSSKMIEKGLKLKPHYGEGDARLFLAESYIKINKLNKAINQWQIITTLDSIYPSYEDVQNEAKKMLLKWEK